MILRGDEPIYIHRRTATGGKDAHGNATYTRSEILIRDAMFAYAGSNETTQTDGTPVDAALTLYLPEGTQVLDGDQFEIRGTRWVKDGDAEYWSAQPGFVPAVVVKIRRKRG